MVKNKVALIILDGFGLGHHDKGDAIFHAKKPFLGPLFDSEKYAKLKTDGAAVGLPSFQCGGSEAGHLTIGAGRPVKQVLTIINDDIESGKMKTHPKLLPLFKRAKEKGVIHFMGMLSDGGIHSFQSHLHGLLKMAQEFGIENIYVHGFLDGRDTEERSAKQFLEELDAVGIGTLATLSGRFFSMDRDNNWERTKKAYDVLCGEKGMKEIGKHEAPPLSGKITSWQEELKKYYKETDTSDYYMPPVVLDTYGNIKEDDTLVCFNFRSDRMRQIMMAMCDEDFSEFDRPFRLDPKNVAVFGSYYSDAVIAYELKDPKVPNTLGEIVSKAGLTQLRITETEKFNHVTFFFSGQRKDEFPGEERILIPSPKCKSYGEKPEMSAREQTDALMKRLEEKEIDLVVQNFANPDLVGHSADLSAGIKAIEFVDECLAKEVPFLNKKGYYVVIFADHGNADEMLEPDGSPSASHTKNKIPCWIIAPDGSLLDLKKEGTLADIAPTALSLLGLEKPKEMTGESLIDSK